MPQTFDTADQLALEIRNDPVTPAGSPEPHLLNYVRNPQGDLGGWGWLSPVPRTTVRREAGGRLTFATVTAQSGVYFTTEVMPRRALATHVRAQFARQDADSSPGVGVRIRVEYLDDTDGVLGQSAQSALVADNGTAEVPATAIPAGTTRLRLRLDLATAGGPALAAGAALAAFNVILVQGSNAELTDPDGIQLDEGWTDILGPTHEIKINRSELDLGTLVATIYGPELDPSTADTIRAGKDVRLRSDVSGTEESLFTGEVLNATVTYDLLNPDPFRRTLINLNAVDRVKVLGNVPRPDGVATLAELPAVLEGAGIPWNVNGETGHADVDPVVVSHNDNAKVIDQLAITRDSQLAYAWVDRFGVVQAWDADQIHVPSPFRPALDETVYADVVVDFDTDRCINIVTLKYLRLDPTTGETEEISYGPYVDLASVREWGDHAQEFTVHGIAEDPATLAGYADAILAANATPQRRLQEATLYLRSTGDLDDWATLDLYEQRSVECARAGIDTAAAVTGVEHTITPDLWTLKVSFAAAGGVAIPQAVPSPPPTAAKTLAELLRPVGEVTMMHGLPSQVWAGWLVLNGANFDPATYPALSAWLTAAGLDPDTLPDYTDRIPVGAGVKAVGAKTGAWTKTITAAQIPPHTHPILRGSDEGTSGTRVKRSGNTTVADATSGANASGTGGAADPVDITPPVIGVYFVIRAVAGVPTGGG